MHKHLYEYMRDTSVQLEALIRELKEFPASTTLMPAPQEGTVFVGLPRPQR